MIPILNKYLLTSKVDILSADAFGQCIVRLSTSLEMKPLAKQRQDLLEDSFICELLESLLVMACDEWHPCRESLTKIDNALRLISVLTERIHTSSKVLKAVLQSISSTVVSGILRQYGLQVREAMRLGFVQGHSTMDVCPATYHEARARLYQSLSIMVLKSALLAPQCGGNFDAPAMTLLLENQCLHCPAQHAPVECTQRRPTTIITPKISMFEAVSTPRIDTASLNWRDNLMREMSRDVDCRYEGVIRLVGEICRDLELRCSESERPLREEQSKSRDLHAKLESSERDKAELESSARNHQSTFSVLETERDYLANQVEATEKKLEELRTSLDNIHQEFDGAKLEAERAAQAAIEGARQQDLVYLATMTGKDEVLEQQSLRLASTENHAKDLENELNRMRRLEASNTDKLNSSKTRIETLNSAVSASERCNKDLQNELIRIKEQNACDTAKISHNEMLIEELNSTIIALNETCNQSGSMISTLKDQLQKVESEASELRMQHETYVSAKDAEIERLNGSHRSLNDILQSELEVARRNATATSEQFTATIAGLNSKVGKLREERKVGVFRIYSALFCS